jgi:hypothetical protein
MSLTRHLDNPGSPVRKYLYDRFAIVEQSKRGSPLTPQASAILKLKDLPREPALKSFALPGYAGVIGSAIDYRIRYYFGLFDVTKTAAARGAATIRRVSVDPLTFETLVGPNSPRAGELADEFFRLHARMIAKLNPVKRRLAEDEENMLACHCIILAYYEALFRAGAAIQSPLYRLSRRATIKSLLALALPECVADVRQLSFAFEEDARALFEVPAILNPTFVGSAMVGGADADIVLGEMLVEIKTLVDVQKRFRDILYQLLGYVLLDYGDQHSIRSISIYFARHRKQWAAPLWHFLLPLPSVVELVVSSREPSVRDVSKALATARNEFKAVVLESVHRQN